MNKQESIMAYRTYIDTHINNVKKAFEVYGEALCQALNISIERLKDMVEVHDQSKYSPEEFEGYRKKFYKSDDDIEVDEVIQDQFDNAWHHHLSFNSHHPEFWVYKRTDEDKVDIHVMDNYSIAEMLLDWAAMGITAKESRPGYDYWISGEGTKKPFEARTVEIIGNCIEVFNKEWVS